MKTPGELPELPAPSGDRLPPGWTVAWLLVVSFLAAIPVLERVLAHLRH